MTLVSNLLRGCSKGKMCPRGYISMSIFSLLKKGGRRKEQHTKHTFFCLAGKQNKCTIYRCAGQYSLIPFSSGIILLHLHCLLHDGLTTDTGDTDRAKPDLSQQLLHAQGGNPSSPQNLTILSSATNTVPPLYLHPRSRLRDVLNLTEKLDHLGLLQKEDSKSLEQA